MLYLNEALFGNVLNTIASGAAASGRRRLRRGSDRRRRTEQVEAPLAQPIDATRGRTRQRRRLPIRSVVNREAVLTPRELVYRRADDAHHETCVRDGHVLNPRAVGARVALGADVPPTDFRRR